jgi:integrase
MTRDRVAVCTGCGTHGRVKAKDLCSRCYARSRIHEVVCIDCGLVRLEHRGGQCASCYRISRTALGICGTCELEKLLWGPVCRGCQTRSLATAGACESCGREVPRLRGRRCGRCRRPSWTATGSCGDCCWWAPNLKNGRCEDCRTFNSESAVTGSCRSCHQRLALNVYRRCRLCSVTRRRSHQSGDPGWPNEPGARGGVQLAFGGLAIRRHSDAISGAPAAQPASARIVRQLRLFSVAPDLSALTTLDVAAIALSGEDLAIRSFAEARGWGTVTTLAVSRAMTLLEPLGSAYPSDAVFAHLTRLALRPSRVREFLADQGRTPPERHPDHMPSWILDQITAFPLPIQAEVAAWVDVLEGRWGRGVAPHPSTVRIYVNTVVPALTEWSVSCSSLREIGSDQVDQWLAQLTGTRRTMIATALRSLFGALKARRRIFVNLTGDVHIARLPRSPVLGLDTASRLSVLASLERPDHRLVVLLAGVHAMTRADILGAQLDDVNLDAATIVVRGTTRPISPLVGEHAAAWLRARTERWPFSANPHLLVTKHSALGIGPSSTSWFNEAFSHFSTTGAELRADRLLAEANESRGDPLRLVRLFGVSPSCAMRYCAGWQLESETDER